MSTRRVLVIGVAGAGKTTLIRRLQEQEVCGGGTGVRKTQSIEFGQNLIDTPGEYAEIPRFYHALITTSMQADLVLFVQDATRRGREVPPGFCRNFPRPVLGAVTKVDHPAADVERACSLLRDAGISGRAFLVSGLTGFGCTELRAELGRRLVGRKTTPPKGGDSHDQ